MTEHEFHVGVRDIIESVAGGYLSVLLGERAVDAAKETARLSVLAIADEVTR